MSESSGDLPSRPPGPGAQNYQQVVDLLGGRRVFRREIRSMLDVHDALNARLPKLALGNVAHSVVVLTQVEVANALGVSVRTLQRSAEHEDTPLTREQSGRAWKLGEILARATDALGNRKQAETWLRAESVALGGRRPIELLTTTAGTELVEQLLGRIEHGVYT